MQLGDKINMLIRKIGKLDKSPTLTIPLISGVGSSSRTFATFPSFTATICFDIIMLRDYQQSFVRPDIFEKLLYIFVGPAVRRSHVSVKS